MSRDGHPLFLFYEQIDLSICYNPYTVLSEIIKNTNMENQTDRTNMQNAYSLAGLVTLSLRLVIGWTYFSAFWRRIILENKLDPDVAGYVGEKFNHFLPNALGIQSLIEYLVTHPELLFWAMILFTIIEGVVGLSVMFGFMTRLMSLGVMGLAGGILLGSGWLGTTCLDEWQIGILGVSGGFALLLAGGGKYSIDYWLTNKSVWIKNRKWLVWLTSGVLPVKEYALNKVVLIGAVAIFVLSLFTNQYFHNGVWGPLHNKSVKPKIEIPDAGVKDGALTFGVYRVEGADVYGSFLIGVTLTDESGNIIFNENGEQLAGLPQTAISNEYVAKVKPGAHSLVIPLGAKASVTLKDDSLRSLEKGNYKLVLTDISGITWEKEIVIP